MNLEARLILKLVEYDTRFITLDYFVNVVILASNVTLLC